MIALITAALLASTPISLDEVREQSRRNTQAMLSAMESYRATQTVRSARSGIYPQISLSGGAGINYRGPQRQFGTFPRPQPDGTLVFEPGTRDIAEATNQSYDLSISVAQLIYDGGKWWNRIEQAGAQQEAAQGQYQEQQLASEFEGVRRFFELYRAQKRANVLDANARRSTEQVQRAEALFEGGRTHKGDLLAAKVNLGNDRLSILQQHNRIVAARTDLAAWLARPPSESLEAVAPSLTDAPLPPFEAALEAARKQRPLYKSLDAQVRAADAAIELARGDFLPRVSASVRGGRQGPTANPFFTDPSQQNFVSAGVDVRWDLFNGFVTEAQTQTARLQRATAELNLKQALYELEAAVQQAVASAEAQVAAIEIAQANRELAAESLKVAEGRFSSGAGSTLEVRDAQLKLTQAELTLLEAQIDAEIARANLERVLGSRVNGVKP